MTALVWVRLGISLLLETVKWLQTKQLLEAGEAKAIVAGLDIAEEGCNAGIKAREDFASAAILALMTTTGIAGTDRRACLIGLTIAGQALEVGCLGPKNGKAAQPSVETYCGPRGSGKVFTPFAWSKADTVATKDQARSYNLAGRAMGCWK